ncbi:MAG: hypothetical protein K1X92_14215 [Bacteroidia bacterium]|nr:hypothetical protein [Bacteroidia bacterium]
MTEFNLVFVLQTIKKYRLYLSVTIGLALILAIIFTMPYFYAPQFQASTIMYPASMERFDFVNIFEKQKELYFYGSPKEVEKLGNFAKSEAAAMFVIDSLNLYDVYQIDKNGGNPKFKVLKEFKGNINVVQTEGSGMKIEAYDIDPQRAADIVNLIVYKVNEMNNELLGKNRQQILTIYENDMKGLQVLCKTYRDSAAYLRKRYNIYSYPEQTRVILEQALNSQSTYAKAKAYEEVVSKYYSNTDTSVIKAKARTKGAEMQLRTISDPNSAVSLNKFQEGVDMLLPIEQNYFRVLEKIQLLDERIVGLKSLKDMSFDSVMSVEKAQASDKKARPVRWVIIMATLLITTIVSIGCLILLDWGLPQILKNT